MEKPTFNIVVTDAEAIELKLKEEQHNYGNYKSDEKYVQDVEALLGINVPGVIEDMVHNRKTVKVLRYPNFSGVNCIVSNGSIENLKRRKQ